VLEYIWDTVLVPGGEPEKLRQLSILRNFALRWVKRKLLQDFLKWFWSQHQFVSRWSRRNTRLDSKEWLRGVAWIIGQVKETARDWAAGRDCVRRFGDSSWWEWPAGSRPHFWRWPLEYRLAVRDGVPPWLTPPFPKWLVPQTRQDQEVGLPLFRGSEIVDLLFCGP
jgi:hypothetical protein